MKQRKSIPLAGKLGALLLSSALVFSAFNLKAQEVKKWDAPESAKKIKNAEASNAESIAAGKTLYAKHCKSCHGATGKGDGPKAANLDVSCKDFTKAEIQAQTDGELYWKTTEGRDPMPTFKKKTTDEERWQIINYVRTFGAKK